MQWERLGLISMPQLPSPPDKESNRSCCFTPLNLASVINQGDTCIILKSNIKWSQHVLFTSVRKVKFSELSMISKENCIYQLNSSKIGVWLWSLGYSLQNMQRKTGRFCSNNYSPTLVSLGFFCGMLRDETGWSSFETGRTKARLNLMYKIWNATVDIDKSSNLCPYRKQTQESF